MAMEHPRILRSTQIHLPLRQIDQTIRLRRPVTPPRVPKRARKQSQRQQSRLPTQNRRPAATRRRKMKLNSEKNPQSPRHLQQLPRRPPLPRNCTRASAKWSQKKLPLPRSPARRTALEPKSTLTTSQLQIATSCSWIFASRSNGGAKDCSRYSPSRLRGSKIIWWIAALMFLPGTRTRNRMSSLLRTSRNRWRLCLLNRKARGTDYACSMS